VGRAVARIFPTRWRRRRAANVIWPANFRGAATTSASNTVCSPRTGAGAQRPGPRRSPDAARRTAGTDLTRCGLRREMLFSPASLNPVAQPSRLRVRAASRRPELHRTGRPVNSQARTPALPTNSVAQPSGCGFERRLAARNYTGRTPCELAGEDACATHATFVAAFEAWPANSFNLSRRRPAVRNQSLDAVCRAASVTELLPSAPNWRRSGIAAKIFTNASAPCCFFMPSTVSSAAEAGSSRPDADFVSRLHASVCNAGSRRRSPLFSKAQAADGRPTRFPARWRGYQRLALQTLADQVRRSVRSVRGNQWMFRMGHPPIIRCASGPSCSSAATRTAPTPILRRTHAGGAWT